MRTAFPSGTLCLVSLASLGWAIGAGLLLSLAPVWMHAAGASPGAIGLNTTIYYLGVAAASPFVPALMRRRGRACVIAGMLLDAVTTACFPLVTGEHWWHVLRLLGGVGTAFSLIPMETHINHDAAPEHRARDFAAYAFCVALGIGVGSGLALPLHAALSGLIFALGGLATLLAVVPAWAGMPPRVEAKEAGQGEPVTWWRHSLGFATAWVQGFLEGGTFAFLALYLLARWHSEALAGVLMGALFAGVVAAQLPIGWLADRLGRWRVLMACQGLLFAGLLLVPLTPWAAAAGVELLVVGAACGAMYPLGLALLGERLPAAALGEANAYYLAANCAGSLMGPLVIGWAVGVAGLSALFVVGTAALMLAASTAPLFSDRASGPA